MTRDLPAGLCVIVHAPQIVAVGHRRERSVERQDLEAVPWQIELADDLGPEQRDDVGGDRELEARNDLLGDGRAPQDVPALEDEHLPSRAREIRGIDKAIVAAADHDDVVVHVRGPLSVMPDPRSTDGTGNWQLVTGNRQLNWQL